MAGRRAGRRSTRQSLPVVVRQVMSQPRWPVLWGRSPLRGAGRAGVAGTSGPSGWRAGGAQARGENREPNGEVDRERDQALNAIEKDLERSRTRRATSTTSEGRRSSRQTRNSPPSSPRSRATSTRASPTGAAAKVHSAPADLASSYERRSRCSRPRDDAALRHAPASKPSAHLVR